MTNGRLANNEKVKGGLIKLAATKIVLTIGLIMILLGGNDTIFGQPTGSSTRESSDTSNRADQNLKSVARVNPSTLAMEFSLPLMSYPGRNGNSLPIGFSYSSKVWRMETGLTWWTWVNTQPKYITDINARYAERSAAGWTSNLLPPRIENTEPQLYKEDGHPWDLSILDEIGINNHWQTVLSGFTSSNSVPSCGVFCVETDPSRGCDGITGQCWCVRYEVVSCPTNGPVFPSTPPPINLYYVRRLQVAMADGSTHEFRESDTPISCGTNQSVCTPDMNGTYLAVDGSGMKFVKSSSGSTLYMPDGSHYTFPVGNSADGTFADKYIDADGNRLSFSRTTEDNLTTNKWTDTMGREIIDPLPYNWTTQTQRPETKTIQLPGFDGDTQDFNLKWERLKPLGCEEDTTGNCTGALEDQTQKLYYETKYDCRGNISTNLNTQGEVLFPEQETGIRPCNSFNILRDSNGDPILDGNGNVQLVLTRFNPVVLSEVELPNGKKYIFKYNRYGEITKITYPTGSFETFVYDKITPMNGAGKPAYDQTNRGVVERKVYQKNATTPDQTWTYSAGLDYGTGSYKVTTNSSTGSNPTTQVKRNERFLHPSSVDNNLFGFNEPLAGFPKEELSYDENQVLRSRTLTEYTTKSVSITSPQTMSVLRDARVKRTVSMAIENGLALASLSETEYNESTTTGNNAQTDPEYFSHLNVKRTKGYHYAVIDTTTAQTGSLATIATYFNQNLLASVAETDYLYDANYKARGISSLVTETRVLNPQNTSEVIAKTQTVYDNLAPSANSNYPSSYTRENYGVYGTSVPLNCPSGTSSVACWQDPNSNYRGKPTTVRLWDNDNNIWHESHTRYDVFGNVVKVKDAAGNEVTTEFANSTEKPYLFAYPTKVIAPAPDPNNSTGTNQTSTAETTYDFMTGLPLSVKDDFGQVTKTEYNDPLLRPTRVYADNFTAPESQTIYDDNNLTVKVRKQIDANGNWDEATTFLDSLGRTLMTQAKDSQGDVFVETKYDLLGRVKWTSNPYRSGEGNKFWSRPRYDEMGRVFESCAPVENSDQNPLDFNSTGACPTGTSSGVTEYGFSTQTGFVGTVVTATDASGRKSRSFTNALGQLVRVDEPSSTNSLEPIPQSTPTPNPSPSPTPTGGGGPTGCSIGGPNCLTNADYPMNSTYYVYNAQGKMVKVIQGDQNRYFKYDSLGRLIRVKQPEQDPNDSLDMTDFYNTTGKWSAGFKYNALGDLIKATDANGVNIINEYDQAKRVTKRCYTKPNFTTTATNCGSISTNDLSANTPTVEYFYDGFMALGQPPTASPNLAKGKLTRVTSSISDTRYTQFDNLGRLLEMEQRTPFTDTETIANATPRVSKYEYNFAGALVKETYPSGRVVRNEFESDGDLSRIYGKANQNAIEKTYANGFSYTPDGKIQRLKLGNNRWESAKFNERLQVTELALGTSDGDGSLWKLEYKYGELNADGSVDENKNTGNIAKQTVSFNGLTNPFVQTYKYDSLYRLTEATEVSGTTQNWKESYGYDRYGNRLDYQKFVGTTELTLDNKAHPEIDSDTNRFTDTVTFNYDKNGNLTKDGESRNFVFNGENKQTEIKDSNGATIGQYFYDGEGKRIKKVTNTEITVFVYSAGKLVAEYSTATPPTNPTTKWTATDQLGSPRVITDANGQVISRRDFMPFGEEVANSIGERQSTNLKYNTPDGIRQKFTGYQKDDETGLDFAEARMYENRHGRFTAVDPLLISGKRGDPQTFNRYVYCLNNPLVYTDPSGLQAGDFSGPVYTNKAETRFSNKKTREFYKPYEGKPIFIRGKVNGVFGNYEIRSNGWKLLNPPDPVLTKKAVPTAKKVTPFINQPLINSLAGESQIKGAIALAAYVLAATIAGCILACPPLAVSAGTAGLAAYEGVATVASSHIGGLALANAGAFGGGFGLGYLSAQLDPTIQGGQQTSGGSPSLDNDPYNPSSVDLRVKPRYEANPAHDPNSPLFNPNKTPEPSDVMDVYNGNLVRSNTQLWWGMNGNGEYYRFSPTLVDNNNVVQTIHFSGIIPEAQVPNEVRKAFRR